MNDDQEGLIAGKVYSAPHCNSEVLHAPGRCVYCDHFPLRQAARSASGIPFTPDEANGWSGNVAVQVGEVMHHMGASWVVEDDKPVYRADHSRLPRGWYCKLPDGHGGSSCPTWPTRLTRIKYALRGRRLP